MLALTVSVANSSIIVVLLKCSLEIFFFNSEYCSVHCILLNNGTVEIKLMIKLGQH